MPVLSLKLMSGVNRHTVWTTHEESQQGKHGVMKVHLTCMYREAGFASLSPVQKHLASTAC